MLENIVHRPQLLLQLSYCDVKNIMAPLTFIDSINSKKHMMLVSDDEKISRKIEFRFLENGLKNREYCIYLTHDNPKYVECEMIKYGINVKHFKEQSLLHVHRISNPIEGSQSILDSMSNMVSQITLNSLVPFRIVGRLVPNVGIEEAIAIQLYLEKTFHGIFDTLDGLVLCTYDFSQIHANDRWKYWLNSLQKHHHVLISHLNGLDMVQLNQNES